MRKRISTERVSALWEKTHPKSKQPPIKAYYASKQELNRLAAKSAKGKGGKYQTKQEYGAKVTPKTHDICGAHYKHGKQHIILVRRQRKAGTTKAIKHELNHIK